ncbi:MAG: porphobilinogen synthase, partial [Desulfurellaceae bacterium]|nr:porphobilinogen synthase [Desulfurellaceae bacterium]
MAFPTHRPRRLRRTEPLRRMVRETQLSVNDLIMPLFIVPGSGVSNPISSMPGIAQLSIDRAVEECKQIRDLGVPGVILFGIPDHKDALGSDAYADDGIIQRTLATLKEAVPGLLLLTDVCFCEYTDHGHCGIVKAQDVDNDATLDILAKEAVSHARAGADIVAPSDMMDGRVGVIRQALDAEGFPHIPILAYAAKFASGFYGPFREAAESTPQ